MSGTSEDIKRVLTESDKAEMLEFVSKEIGSAVKGVVVLLVDSLDGHTHIVQQQFGFEYLFELHGFLGNADALVDEMFQVQEDN